MHNTELVFLVVLLTIISLAMTIMTRRKGHVHEAFEVDENDVKQLKSDLARLALHVRTHNNLHSTDEYTRIQREATEAAVQAARAHVSNENQMYRDDLNSLRKRLDEYSNKLSTVKEELASLGLSDEDRVALFQTLAYIETILNNIDFEQIPTITDLENIGNQIYQLQSSMDTIRKTNAAMTIRIGNMDASYQSQLVAVTNSVSNLRSTDIKKLHDSTGSMGVAIANVHSQLEEVRLASDKFKGVRAAFDTNINTLLLGNNTDNKYMGFDATNGRFHRPSKQQISIGQSASGAGSGFVEDVRIVGDGSKYHAISFGGTMADPSVSTVIAERQLRTGDSEMLIAKYGQGRGSTIRHHAAEHVFTVPNLEGSPVPTGVANALTASDEGTSQLRVSAKGIQIGDHILRSAGSDGGLLLCDKVGNACSPVVTAASSLRQMW